MERPMHQYPDDLSSSPSESTHCACTTRSRCRKSQSRADWSATAKNGPGTLPRRTRAASASSPGQSTHPADWRRDRSLTDTARLQGDGRQVGDRHLQKRGPRSAIRRRTSRRESRLTSQPTLSLLTRTSRIRTVVKMTTSVSSEEGRSRWAT